MRLGWIRTAAVSGLIISACTPSAPPDAPAQEASASKRGEGTQHALGQYWFDGNAEVNVYALEQVRYGEVRKGKAVAIFVTEDFSRSRHVKLERQDPDPADKVSVLKLNFSKEFNTGIYPYRMYLSSFTELGSTAFPEPLKIASSIAEWCGIVYTQMNRGSTQYEIQNNSYFEAEGSSKWTVPLQMTEDGIMNLIRINPDLLPASEVEMIPSTFFTRLKHKPIEAVTTRCSLKSSGDSLAVYRMEMPAHERTSTITFRRQPPFEIEEWTETYPEGGQLMTTRAVLLKRSKLPYWQLNTVSDSSARSALGLF